jgi:hypothetical protein
MKCLIKNRDCPHAGNLKMKGFPEWGEEEGIFEYTVCYNDEIGRDVNKCK